MDYMTSKSIEFLDWTSQSTDLNPIENVWAIMKRKLMIKRVMSGWGGEIITGNA